MASVRNFELMQELEYIDKVVNISNNKILSEYEKLEITDELRADADKLVKEILKDVDLDLHKWWVDRIVTQLLNGASHQSIVSDIVQLAYDSKRKGSLYQTNTNRDSIEATYANINKNNKELDKLISRAGSL